jgi:hypothetical protein
MSSFDVAVTTADSKNNFLAAARADGRRGGCALIGKSEGWRQRRNSGQDFLLVEGKVQLA